MGDEQSSGSFAQFVEAVSAAPVHCDGLHVRYESPSLGEMEFGWTEPLRVNGQDVQLHSYPRFDNPYCQADIGDRCYTITRGDEQIVLDFR